MKNLTSIQLLELININAMSTVKGGTATVVAAPKPVTGEWWGAGSL